MHHLPFIAAIVIAAPTLLCAADWPQWRGPQRSGITSEKLDLSRWPADGAAPVAWRLRVGKGHPNVSISRGLAYTAGWDGRNDTIYCLDAATGQIKWKQSYPCGDIVQWPGPRASPTIDVGSGLVFTLSQHGLLHAFEADTGKVRWKKQLSEKFKPDDDYGFTWSPLVQNDLLILSAGSRGVAIRIKDGSTAWGDDGQRGACASAVPFEHAGRRGVAIITTAADRDSANLLGVDPRDGSVLWRHGPWKEKWGAVCVDLVVHQGGVFITSSEQFKQSARFTIVEGKLRQDWTTTKFACYTGGCVLIDGHLYGIDTRRGGQLKCLDWRDGSEKWAGGEFGVHGTLIAADGKLLVQSATSGELFVIEATPEGYRVLRKMSVFTKDDRVSTFTAPVYANGLIYCRSYEGELVCLRP